MRHSTLRASALAMASIVGGFVFGACGGSTTSDLLGGGGPGGGGGSDAAAGSDAPAVDGGGGGDGGSSDAGASDARPDAPGLDCDALRKRVDDLRPKAVECLATVDVSQCDAQIDDICCKATVNKASRGGKAVKDFQAAVAAFKAAKCDAACPATPCRAAPSFMCVPDGLGATCVQ